MKWSDLWSKRSFVCSQPLNKKSIATSSAKRVFTSLKYINYKLFYGSLSVVSHGHIFGWKVRQVSRQNISGATVLTFDRGNLQRKSLLNMNTTFCHWAKPVSFHFDYQPCQSIRYMYWRLSQNRFRIPTNAKYWYFQCTREWDMLFLARNETCLVSLETHLVCFETRETRLVSRDGGNLLLSGTVCIICKPWE